MPDPTDEILLKYAGPVPRYTSYPTANHFDKALSPTLYQDWLGDIAPDADLSLYFHVPFCRRLCWFCGCTTTVLREAEVARSYADLLVRELNLVRRHLPDAGRVRHIHWGGGTPTALGSEALARVTDEARALLDFDDAAELAIEIDPRTLTPELARTLGRLGFSRASIGVQDLDPAVQAAVNRVQPLDVCVAAADELRSAGIERVNIDLMVGLPGQTEGGVRRSVEEAVEALGPDRVAVFAYAHVPGIKRHQRLIDATALPGPAARLAQTRAAAAALSGLGYVAIGMDHYARPEDPLAEAARLAVLRRNFQGYTDDPAEILIGLGASAIGAFPQGYVQSEPKVPDYRRAIESGQLPVARGRILNADDRLRRDAIERIMCDLRVDLDDVAARWHVPASRFDPEIEMLRPLVEDGLVTISGRSVEVVPAARYAVRSVCSVFDRYFRAAQAPAGHAAGL
ncbi:MAG: oxygen-independent coproporphyrinogen III oxidase [Bauldia sp.]